MFVYFPHALREDLLTDDDWQHIELELVRNPTAGAVIAGTGGARKLRIRLLRRGKRGAARTIYLYLTGRERIYFLATYAKNEQADLTPEDKRTIRNLIQQLQREDRQ